MILGPDLEGQEREEERKKWEEDCWGYPDLARCPSCQHLFGIPPDVKGKKIKCKNCGNLFAS